MRIAAVYVVGCIVYILRKFYAKQFLAVTLYAQIAMVKSVNNEVELHAY